jgi:hypothetical protein
VTHQRKTIRDAVVTLLDTGTIVASGKVFSNRAVNVKDSDLPVLNVYTQQETSSVLEFCSTKLDRSLSLVVEAVAKVTTQESLDDTLDALCEEIEAALSASSSWNGTVFESFLSGTSIEIERDGETYIGRALLTYDVRYHY